MRGLNQAQEAYRLRDRLRRLVRRASVDTGRDNHSGMIAIALMTDNELEATGEPYPYTLETMAEVWRAQGTNATLMEPRGPSLPFRVR